MDVLRCQRTDKDIRLAIIKILNMKGILHGCLFLIFYSIFRRSRRYWKSLKSLPANCFISFAVRSLLPNTIMPLSVASKYFKTGKKSPSPDSTTVLN